MASYQKVPKFDFKVNFLCQTIFQIFLNFFFWEDENNGFLKLWFLKTSEAPTNPILKIQ